MNIAEIIRNSITSAVGALGISFENAEGKKSEIHLEHPSNRAQGDYASSVALSLAKKEKKNPLELAVLIVAEIMKVLPQELEKAEVAGPGFINFYLSPKFLTNSVKQVLDTGDTFGKNNSLQGKLIVIDYTDPNPFKEFHIGHLMSNVIGEFLATVHEWNGGTVKRICYQGDVGRHVATAMWGLRLLDIPWPKDDAQLSEKAAFLGKAYALGSLQSKDNKEAEEEIKVINQKLYDRTDNELNDFYDKGKEWSLEAFEEIYQKLGTIFDRYMFESQTSQIGLDIVKTHIGKTAEDKAAGKVFEESEGAVIFKGEEYGLHTQVLITSTGLPIYGAKDIGLAKLKADTYPNISSSLIVTAYEQRDNFKVVKKALTLIMPELGNVTDHVGHGMLRLSEGKMSSRTGNVITGSGFIIEVEDAVKEVMKDREMSEEERKVAVQAVSVGAIKFSILKQALGKDIIYNKEQSLSFDGDSGPYLQYTHTRAQSILRKAGEQGMRVVFDESLFNEVLKTPEVEKLASLLYRFEEVVANSLKEKAPQYVVTFILELASAFNGFYASTQIIDKESKNTSVLLSLVKATATVLKNGLKVLAMPVPDKM